MNSNRYVNRNGNDNDNDDDNIYSYKKNTLKILADNKQQNCNLWKLYICIKIHWFRPLSSNIISGALKMKVC